MMKKKKPIRKHSKPRRILLGTQYYGKMFMRLYIGLLFINLASLCAVATLASGIMTLRFLVHLLAGSIPNFVYGAKYGAICLGSFLCALKFNQFAYRIYRAYETLPQGHLLNPLPPEPNEILPEAKVLVRASSVSDAAQKETLLRPAAATADAEPQILLRAASETE